MPSLNVSKFSNVLSACCLAMLLLAGCGQKGDLYLPAPAATNSEPAASNSEPAAAEPSPGQAEDNEATTSDDEDDEEDAELA